MKFLNFLHAEGSRLGALIADTHILDLTAEIGRASCRERVL